MQKNDKIFYSARGAEIQDLQHHGLEDAFLIQSAGFHAVFRIKTAGHSVFDLTVAPGSGLADILIHGKRRDAEGGADLRGGALLILHDFDMLQKAELAKEHGEHIHSIRAGEELIPHQQKGRLRCPETTASTIWKTVHSVEGVATARTESG